MAGYNFARILARMLSHEAAAMLLGKTLKEAQDTAGDLAEIAEAVIRGEELCAQYMPLRFRRTKSRTGGAGAGQGARPTV